MITSAPPPGPAPSPTPAQTAPKAAQPQADIARGETAAANVRAETARAIDAPEQAIATPRLRDQETKERPESVFDELVGPEPTFEESPLERQARVALDPPEITPPLESREDDAAKDVVTKDSIEIAVITEIPAFEDPPPTPTERAEVSFAETRTLSAEPKPATIDVAR